MKVQTRLSLFSSVAFGVIFLILSLLIYTLYYTNAKKNIYNNLKKTADITALFYLEEDELNKYEFAKVREQFNKFVANSNYQIYNEDNSISYATQMESADTSLLDKIRESGNMMYADDQFFCYGIYYEDNQGNFVVITRERKEELTDQLNTLLGILIASLLIGIVSVILLSRWMANIAYRPFRQVIDQVNNISTNNLEVQIETPNTKDELQDLIETFNSLLSKISETFVIQKNFVNYISHEFKTPLTSVLGNLEVFSIKDRSPEEYQKLSLNLITDIRQLEDILNTLMVVSDLKIRSEITPYVRIDELIWEISRKISEKYSEAKIQVDISITPDNENLLSINTHKTQLFMALLNLIDNAIKYSPNKSARIQIYKEEDRLYLSIIDKGMGIPANQLREVSKPFYRADNTSNVQGTGIGLSIALRILEKNNIQYTIESEEGKGTSVILMF